MNSTDMTRNQKLSESINGSIQQICLKYISELHAQHVKDCMTRTRLEGKLTGPAPVGYLNSRDEKGRSKTIVDPERGPLIKKAFEMLANGEYSMKEIVDHLNSLGFRSKRSKAMSVQSLNRILRNRVYAGEVFVDDETGYVPSSFTSIVDLETFNNVQRTLMKNAV